MASSSSSSDPAAWIYEENLEMAFSLLSNTDRGAAAAVSREWRRIERGSRPSLALKNCYAADPRSTVKLFPRVQALTVKGKPRFGDFGAFPPDWGAYAEPWIDAARTGWQKIKEITFKRMVVTDQCLDMIATNLKYIEVLRLIQCDGFSSAGLAKIAKSCSFLRELELDYTNNQMKIPTNWLSYDETPTTFTGAGVQMGHWICDFPAKSTRLETINISCIMTTEHDMDALVRLMRECRQLRKLLLSDGIALEKVAAIIKNAPNLVELRIGRFENNYQPNHVANLQRAIAGCKNLERLHGNWSAAPHYAYLEALGCVCISLTCLNLYEANLPGSQLTRFISKCHNLQKLWVMDLIGDEGLAVVASSCTKLRELRVFPHNPGGQFLMTEIGLLKVSASCHSLGYILYWCCRMTNAALKQIAQDRRDNLTCFRLGIRVSWYQDEITRDNTTIQASFDEGFGAIVKTCKNLRRLSLGGYLTDRVFEFIGEHGKRLEMLSIASAGKTENGLDHILRGCRRLKKIDIKDCPFGDTALLANIEKLKTMRSIFMLRCTTLTLGGIRKLAKETCGLNFEIMLDVHWPLWQLGDNYDVKKLFVYPTISGPRSDAPSRVIQLRTPVR